MKILLLLAVCVASVLCVFASDDPTTSLAGVQDLTPDTFDKFVNGAKHALVEFYAPWCGHCKRMTGDYKKLGETVSKDGSLSSRVVIAKVNADDHKELATRFGVTGYPTVKWFSRGKPVTEPEDYRGARTADKFLEFIKEKLDTDKTFGRVEEMDALAAKFVADKADKKAILKEAEAAAETVSDELKDNAKLYLTFMQKAIDKGDSYFLQETGRLERILKAGGVKAEKAELFSKKLSVLSAFIDDDDDDVDEE